SHDRTPAKIVGEKSTRETTQNQGFPSSGWSARRCLPKLRDKKRAALGWHPARNRTARRARRAKESSPRPTAVGSRRARWPAPERGVRWDRSVGSSAPSRG